MRFYLFLLAASLLLVGCLEPTDSTSSVSPTPAASVQTLDDAIAKMNVAQLNFIRATKKSELVPVINDLAVASSELAFSADQLYLETNDSASAKAYSHVATIAHLQASNANDFRTGLIDGSFDFSSARKKVGKIGITLFTSVALNDQGKPQEFADAAGESTVSVDSLG